MYTFDNADHPSLKDRPSRNIGDVNDNKDSNRKQNEYINELSDGFDNPLLTTFSGIKRAKHQDPVLLGVGNNNNPDEDITTNYPGYIMDEYLVTTTSTTTEETDTEDTPVWCNDFSIDLGVWTSLVEGDLFDLGPFPREGEATVLVASDKCTLTLPADLNGVSHKAAIVSSVENGFDMTFKLDSLNSYTSDSGNLYIFIALINSGEYGGGDTAYNIGIEAGTVTTTAWDYSGTEVDMYSTGSTSIGENVTMLVRMYTEDSLVKSAVKVGSNDWVDLSILVDESSDPVTFDFTLMSDPYIELEYGVYNSTESSYTLDIDWVWNSIEGP